MSETPASPRRYDEAEVRHLLERAAEIQHREPAATDATGLTLAQLERIALEAGIDVAALRRAADELEGDVAGGPLSRRARGLAGAPLVLVLERSFPADVSVGQLEALLPVVQDAADASGQATLVGNTLSWQSRSPPNLRDLQILIASRGGETRIRIEERFGGLAGVVFGSGVGGIGAGVGIGVGAGVGASIGSVVMMFGFPLGVIGATYLGARSLFRVLVGRRHEVLQRLAARLERELGLPGEAPPAALPGSDRPADEMPGRLSPPRSDGPHHG